MDETHAFVIFSPMTNERKNPHAVALGKLGGKSRNAAKIAAAKTNGRLGGRPKKNRIEPAQVPQVGAKTS